METYFKPDERSAYDAIFEAQKISFAPIIFQSTRALLKTGILKALEDSAETGMSIEELSKKCDVPEYGVGVLLDMALSSRVVWLDTETDHYHLNKIGHYLLNDQMTKVNFNFTADVNYAGMERLLESVAGGRAAGLTEFTEEENTIYPILADLPEEAKKSWFDFDHFYSDRAFGRALKKIFGEIKPKVIMDIGANTGKWAIRCLEKDPDVKMVLVDLPKQLEVSKKNIEERGFSDRVEFVACDMLKDELPKRPDVDMVWMSQFLDCFSPEQIENILLNVKQSVPEDSHVMILELFWDRQAHEAAAFILNSTSLYFTAMANGTSRMYRSKYFKKYLANSGYEVLDQIDNIAVGGHSLLTCRKEVSN